VHRDGCKEHGECYKWELHKFRRIYATRTLQIPGMNARTVQMLMSHADLESTMRYLRPAEGATLQGLINQAKW